MEYLFKIETVLLIVLGALTSACNKEPTPGSANHRFYESMKWNDQHSFVQIQVPVDNYTIISTADIHAGGTKNLDSLIGKATRMDAASLVIAGDLTAMGMAADFIEFEKHLPFSDSMKIFLLAGNHDLYLDGWPEFYKRFGSSTYYFTVKTPGATDLFIGLESGGFSLGSKQLEWLKGILEKNRPDYRRCIIFTHVNYLRTRRTLSTNPFPEEVKSMMSMFHQNKVDMIVAGHDHEHSFESFGNTTYIIMDALEDGFKEAGYLRLTLTGGVIQYKFEKL